MASLWPKHYAKDQCWSFCDGPKTNVEASVTAQRPMLKLLWQPKDQCWSFCDSLETNVKASVTAQRPKLKLLWQPKDQCWSLCDSPKTNVEASVTAWRPMSKLLRQPEDQCRSLCDSPKTNVETFVTVCQNPEGPRSFLPVKIPPWMRATKCKFTTTTKQYKNKHKNSVYTWQEQN